MLIRLLTSEIPKYWPAIKESLIETIMKEKADSDEKLNNMLRSLLTGRLSCWLLRREDKIKAVVITTVMIDEFLRERNVLIYSAYTKNANAKDWFLAFDTLKIYAKDIKCKKIVFYTKVPQIVNVSKHLGFTEIYSVCEHIL